MLFISHELTQQNINSNKSYKYFSKLQLVQLEKQFCTDKYLCRRRCTDMAQELNLTERQVKVRFQNQRMKFKKEQEQRAYSDIPFVHS
ncbi:unnamed protein product [Acanthoscelides obtectus]|uniref:Homeobox domain-containing protein n=1 Tax=Acanthoscelides obtectus TaxID=200917 RepID=A0A9P0LHV1_ACAOB|nr:unnamed protein product [Acanthoscelides obtectus]CAK1654456.1 Homeobox protein Hox-D3a [Acanthoscelides obtectus]